MACPTCSRTMQCLGLLGGSAVHWCPSCGTLLTGGIDPDRTCVERPILVDACREFGKTLNSDGAFGVPETAALWRTVVVDRIYPEGER